MKKSPLIKYICKTEDEGDISLFRASANKRIKIARSSFRTSANLLKEDSASDNKKNGRGHTTPLGKRGTPAIALHTISKTGQSIT